MNLDNDNRQAPRIGDWVSGTSLMDERFIGYVEAIDKNGLVKIYVTQCDHDAAVGSSIRAWFTHIDRLPEHDPSDIETLRSLMDLALMTRDRAWFDELAAKLANRKSEPSPSLQADHGTPGTFGGSNRLFRRVNTDY
ncbi:hypothetical protein O9H85_28060 [Paenibacillus filicis]|uniref:IDEAL domain-containing protein n=1 Tax=Paenibacillus gyeongsangnamensis TaxID=3388067 RepID=A0ABT4QH53_9BACL|nr:hypothetical protein [Paenibacillus filicis]MCZ8516179.1 hypothetical protein [Paenibacillus filicis]